MSKAEASDAAMADETGSHAQDLVVRIAAALEVLPAFLEGQAALVNNLEVVMPSVEQQKVATSSMNERIADLTKRIQQLEGDCAEALASEAGDGGRAPQHPSNDKSSKNMRGAAGKAPSRPFRRRCTFSLGLALLKRTRSAYALPLRRPRLLRLVGARWRSGGYFGSRV